MKCQWFNYVVPVNNFATGPVRSVAKCETHNWMSDYPMTTDSLCPIGQIELARDEAITAIKEAKNGH